MGGIRGIIQDYKKWEDEGEYFVPAPNPWSSYGRYYTNPRKDLRWFVPMMAALLLMLLFLLYAIFIFFPSVGV